MDWQLLPTAPGACPTPADLPPDGWAPAIVPGTVAEALGVDLDRPPALEDRDWWYRTTLRASAGPHQLRLEGLATLAEVWLDGELVLRSSNMFRRHLVELGELGGEHDLALAFRSLDAELAGRRPRPRWKTALVAEQKLRWIRTSLAGRVPGWTPLTPAVGPWREVVVEPLAELREVHLAARLEGGDGVLEIDARCRAREAWLVVGGARVQLRVEGGRLRGRLELPDVEPWWPHTHGAPITHEVCVEIDGRRHGLGEVGFRELDFEEGRLRVNGREVFCRGACWTLSDPLRLDPRDLEASLRQARGLGLNMIRVGGTTAYGSDAFYALCDRLGILVWQDFMFANFDYPLDDESFRREAEQEVEEVLTRLARHASVALYCGGSEIAQQAAMLGISEPLHPFFLSWLEGACGRLHPGVPYLPNSPWGGVLPFHTREGVTHYFGVGAYRRPEADVRRAEVRFAAECLGLSNVPDERGTRAVTGGAPVVHHPAWKAGIPRDRHAGWDFEDVRDHYLRELHGVDPVALRWSDTPGYLARSRTVSGELMKRVFAEWRRPGSPCGGALVWQLRDLRPGAGCGILDHGGAPKPVAHALRRAWARRAVLLTDEGLDGVDLHVLNETEEPLVGRLELLLYDALGRPVGQGAAPIELGAHERRSVRGEGLLEAFGDLAYAYHFGPPRHRVVVGRLLVDDEVVHQDALFPAGHELPRRGAELLAVATEGVEGIRLELESDAFLQSVSLVSRTHVADDDFFHLVPGHRRAVHLRPAGASGSFRVQIRALNLDRVVTARL